eukprot:265542-Chlamydomonas_euryale.AAC.2
MRCGSARAWNSAPARAASALALSSAAWWSVYSWWRDCGRKRAQAVDERDTGQAPAMMGHRARPCDDGAASGQSGAKSNTLLGQLGASSRALSALLGSRCTACLGGRGARSTVCLGRWSRSSRKRRQAGSLQSPLWATIVLVVTKRV